MTVPDAVGEVPEVRKGEELQVELSFTNPLSIALDNIKISVEGAGSERQSVVVSKPLESGATLTETVTVSPRRKGAKRELIATFNSKQLTGIKGSLQIKVNK